MTETRRKEYEAQLLELLKTKALTRGAFVLASGASSTYYLDCRRVSLDHDGSWMIGKLLMAVLEAHRVRVVGGPATAAIPLVTACVLAGNAERGFYTRAVAKEHGSKSLIEGDLRAGDRVCVLDDVLTSGRSLLTAIRTVESAGAEVVLVTCLVDRLQGARELLQGDWAYAPLFTIRDLGIEEAP